MAQHAYRTCDEKIKRGKATNVCGEPVPDNRSTTFSLDGVDYEADLCEQHRSPLVQTITEFAKIGTRVSRRVQPKVQRRRAPSGGTFTTKDVRDWLRGLGRDVPESGRIKQSIIDEFLAAQRQETAGSNA